MRIVSEPEFRERLREVLATVDTARLGYVTGPGRSGAIAAVYASHLLGLPFVPYGSKGPVERGHPLLIDTARASGATLRKAARKYEQQLPLVVAAYEEPPSVAFWYEVPRSRRYRHERRLAA